MKKKFNYFLPGDQEAKHPAETSYGVFCSLKVLDKVARSESRIKDLGPVSILLQKTDGDWIDLLSELASMPSYVPVLFIRLATGEPNSSVCVISVCISSKIVRMSSRPCRPLLLRRPF